MSGDLMIGCALAGAYVVGSIPTGLWIGLVFFKEDIRLAGSGNIGATNTLRVLGKVPGSIALLVDMLKGAAAVYLVGHAAAGLQPGGGQAALTITLLKIAGGVLAVAGHNWSLFLKFKGGKGVATSCGVFLILAPLPTAGALGVFIVILAAFRYVSVASMTAALSLPALVLWRMRGQDRLVIFGISLVMAVMIIIRHRSNLVRLCRGIEPRIDRPKEPADGAEYRETGPDERQTE